MLTDFVVYLLQGTLLLTVFALAYRLFFCRLTHFHWNRAYLLAGVLISCLLPLLPAFALFGTVAPAGLELRLNTASPLHDGFAAESAAQAGQTMRGMEWAVYAFLGVYLAGFLYRSWQLYRNLRAVYGFIQTSQKVDEGVMYSVYVQSRLPTFSFWRFIFLNPDHNSLTPEEQAQVLLHEEIHVRHWHTLDLLLFELVSILFWFHPVVRYLHLAIRQVHEYTVDSVVTRLSGNVRQYGYLLLKMTAQNPLPLLASFSNKPIFQRIHMLTQKPSGPMKKLRFLIILPLLALSLVVCSCFRQDTHPAFQAVKSHKGTPMGTITWKGNTLYSADYLDQIVGVQPGDLYDKEAFADRLSGHPGADLASLYMDKGYLFYNAEVHEKHAGNAVNLEIQIYEGKPVNIEKVVFKGNNTVTNEQLLKTVAIRPGELFSRSKLVQSQKALAESGHFDPARIGINPVPNLERNTVDLEFVVVEK
ncbi:POTRA domain-containing protein [Larkinella insperata]|uniref:POTRA domain-containing protein n=1 Tax=Larkinella insperata TaxID=332158 RepID=A0ABW3QI99_9BACT|nr:M56 family metallopeptidase [Larkinella insperata]